MEKGIGGGHDWIKGRGPIESSSIEEAAERPVDIEAARELAEGDAVLRSDLWARAVIDNGGIVTIKATGEQVAVDLGHFLYARRLYLERERMKDLDLVATRIAEGGPEAASAEKQPAMQ